MAQIESVDILPAISGIDAPTAESDRINDEYWISEQELLSSKQNISSKGIGISECIDELQVAAWVHHELLYGQILCWDELMTVKGFGLDEIRCLKKHFILPETHAETGILKHVTPPEKTLLSWQSRRSFLTKAESEHFSTNHGDDWNHQLKLRIAAEHYRFGVTTEKDAGENAWGKAGPDYLSMYLELKPADKHWQLVVGDQHIQIGQGLLAGMRRFGNILSDPGAAINNRTCLRPHASLNETGFLRGVSFISRIKNIGIFATVSKTREDGNFQIDSIPFGSSAYYTADESGYHRTDSERAKMDISERKTGMAGLSIESGAFTLGVSGMIWQDQLAEKRFRPAYREKNISGALSLHTRLKRPYGYLFGELAIGALLQKAWTWGIACIPDKRITATLYAGSSPEVPMTPFSAPIGFQNDDQSYLGINFTVKAGAGTELIPFLHFSQRSFLQLGGITLVPRYDRGLRVNYRFGKTSVWSLTYRSSIRWSDGVVSGIFTGSRPQSTETLRMHCELKPSLGISLSSRVEFRYSQEQGGSKKSFMGYQDMNLSKKSWPLKLCLRGAVFNAPEHTMAIRVMDDDLPGNLRQSLLYGRGFSWYMIIQPLISGPLDIWVKYGMTTYFDRRIEHPFNGTTGNGRSEIAFQFRLQIKGK